MLASAPRSSGWRRPSHGSGGRSGDGSERYALGVSMTTVFATPAELKAAEGQHLGYSDWIEITQERMRARGLPRRLIDRLAVGR